MWLTGPVAPWYVGSSQTRARTHVPCIGRQVLNHCATREAQNITLKWANREFQLEEWKLFLKTYFKRVKILELKSTVSEVENSFDELKQQNGDRKKESVNLKKNQYQVFNL